MEDPTFEPFDLTEFVESGLLMVVNERVLWPLGLALTVNWDRNTERASDLHVRQWVYPDGRHEIIESDEDEIAIQRRRAFEQWVYGRAGTMPISGEAQAALSMLRPR